MEQAHLIDRGLSSRGVARTLPALLIAIALVAVAAWAIAHRSGPPTAANKHVPLRARSATSVLVLNGTWIAGAAGGVSSRLLAKGYRRTLATNAQVKTYARSVVLYRPGWQREAERLAKDAHIPTVAPLDGALRAARSRFPVVLILGR